MVLREKKKFYSASLHNSCRFLLLVMVFKLKLIALRALFFDFLSLSLNNINQCNQYLSPLTLGVRIPLRRGVLDTTLCDKVCQWLATGQWFSPGIPVSSTNKTDHHDIAEILLKAVFSIINLYLYIRWGMQITKIRHTSSCYRHNIPTHLILQLLYNIL